MDLTDAILINAIMVVLAVISLVLCAAVYGDDD